MRRPLLVLGVVVLVAVGYLLLSDRASDTPRTADVPEIVADCSVDVTAELNEVMAMSDGSIVQLRQGGCYRLDGTLSLEGRRGITIDGNGATLDGSYVDGARERRHIRIRDGGDLVIQDLAIVGSRCPEFPCEGPGLSEHERQHGVAVENVDGMTIQRVTIMNVWGDFVYISQKGDGERSSDVVVSDNYFRNSGRQGIAPSGVVGLEVRNNVIIDAGRTVFDFEAEGDGAENILLIDNDVVRPNNATLNVNCSDRGTGIVLNQGPISLIGNRIYQSPLEVDTSCSGQTELSSQLDVIVEDNRDSLPGEPELPELPPMPALR